VLNFTSSSTCWYFSDSDWEEAEEDSLAMLNEVEDEDEIDALAEEDGRDSELDDDLTPAARKADAKDRLQKRLVP